MKKLFTSFVLFGLALLPYLHLNAQKTVEYDFCTKTITVGGSHINCKKITKIDDCNKGIIIKVKNINNLLYKTKIVVNGKDIHNTPPPLFTNFYPGFGNTLPLLPEPKVTSTDTSADGGGHEKLDGKENSFFSNKENKNYYDDVIQNYEKFIETYTALANKAMTLSRPNVCDSLMKKCYENNTCEPYTEIRTLADYYNKFYIALVKLDLAAEENEIDKAVTLMKERIDALMADKNLALFNTALGLLNDKTFNFTSSPFFPEGDIAEITIKITPRSEAIAQMHGINEESFTFPVYFYNKWDVSFSSGLAVSFLRSENFTTKEETPGSFKIIKENHNNPEIMPCAMMHLEYKFRDISMGPHIGVAHPFSSNLLPQFLLGGSFLIGTKNRVAANISYAYGLVKRPSADTNTGEDITYTSKPTINLINRWTGGFAFSLTYNIFNP